MPSEIPLTLPDDCLATFVDDTGHETLVKGHPVYGLGGCAALVRDLDSIIRAPWCEVRRKVTGSPDMPLHANTFAGFATKENIKTVADFFRAQPFARLGAIISLKTKLADELGSVPTIAKVLQERIREIASRTAFRSVAVIFESSDRADRLVEKAFQGFGLREDGKPLPVECYFMRKEHGEPALEVGDFIMHAVGRQARQNLAKRGVFVPDFFCPRCTSISRLRRISAVWARLESAEMPCAGRALHVRPAPAMRFAVLSLILLVLATRAEARLIAPDIDAVGAAPPSNAQVPLALMLQDETGGPRTLQAAIAHTPAVLILADYACQALCGPVLALAAASLECSGLQAGKDYRLVVIGLDPRKGPAQAKAMKAAQIGENGPLAEATTLLSADDVTLHQVTTAPRGLAATRTLRSVLVGASKSHFSTRSSV